MKKIFSLILSAALLLTLIFLSMSCSVEYTNTTTPAATQTKTAAPTPPKSSTEPDQAPYQSIITDLIKNSSTFKFDGVVGSIKFIKSGPSPISSFRSTAFTFEYQTLHPGHSDRNGTVLAQVITNHTLMILVNDEKGVVVSAICDNTWNMLTEKELPVTVSGIVMSGGNTFPKDGPMDAPRTFVYVVQRNDGTTVNVSYTAYPPSPVGDVQKAMIKLDFYNGTISVGDKLETYGTLDKNTNTVIVAEQGNYIRTSIPKMEVIGLLIGGGDSTQLDGPIDAPRKFTYKLQKDDGTFINVGYTAYPPSPVGDTARAKITLSYYDGEPKAGDYMKAYGTYDKNTNTIFVAEQGDFIKTYPLKP